MRKCWLEAGHRSARLREEHASHRQVASRSNNKYWSLRCRLVSIKHTIPQVITCTSPKKDQWPWARSLQAPIAGTTGNSSANSRSHWSPSISCSGGWG